MKKIIYIVLSMLLVGGTLPLQARKQWTEKQAWAWEKKVGVIKGFNQPEPTPGQTLEDIYAKAKETGLNSVRMWIGGRTADDQIKQLRKYIEIAKKYDMMLSPVLCLPVSQEFIKSKGKDEASLLAMKEHTKKMIGAFANEECVISWDLWNEPGCANFGLAPDEQFYFSLDAIAKIAEWAYEMNPKQAITSSIFWRNDLVYGDSPLAKRAREVEAMMDVHNFHNYSCAINSDDQGKDVEKEIAYLREIGNRPIICTECLTRDNNSGLSRTFAAFAKNNIHFYIWGLYLCDANWTIRWGRSAYDPYDPGFHNLFRPDGEPIDARDMDLIRNYTFTNGVSTDIGAEYTDKWDSQRAWRWMSTGPVKGKVTGNVKEALKWLDSHEANTFNSLNVKLDYESYTADQNEFFAMFEAVLAVADKKGITVLPTLLCDDDLKSSNEDLAKYEAQVLRRYKSDARIQAWDLYYHPGEKCTDKARLEELTHLLFRYARFEFPNQPVMSTPMVKVKPFEKNFNYHDAFLHGRRNGWNMMTYEGGATAELCALIWKLSDVIAFSSNQSAGQTGWIKAVAYRYSRPIFCTQWEPTDASNATETLDNFARSHVFWYQKGNTQLPNLSDFKFRLVGTPR